jgi:hypothetical protein
MTANTWLYKSQVGSSIGKLRDTKRVLSKRSRVRNLETNITTNLLIFPYKKMIVQIINEHISWQKQQKGSSSGAWGSQHKQRGCLRKWTN